MPTRQRRQCPHEKMIRKLAGKVENALWRASARLSFGDSCGARADAADAQHYAMQALRLARGLEENKKREGRGR